MAKRLTDNINSQFFEAANRMTSKKARRKIVAYVESYDDVFFWRSVLGKFENEKRYFDIMLPTRNQHLDRGKKAAISSMLKGVGRDMIACVDADYDYLRQGSTESSQQMLENPYIFHTYAYAIENFQCYARGLHETCVMVTLNDRRIFDFERFLESYSRTIWPLFLWHMLFYVRHRKMSMHFDMAEFDKVIFHTYAYAIENFQCYARGLHETCVMVTLNDRRIFDFERFLESYSRTIWPLFLWHMLFYVRHRKMSMHFDMAEFDKVIMLPSVRIQDPKWAIDYLGKKVRAKLFQLERRFKKFKDELDEMALYLNNLGVNESNTYLYIQGHHLFDLVVSPIVQSVCDALRNDRENEIRDRALHSEQARTEMACYENSLGKVKMMMKKNTFYQFSPEFQKIQADVEKYLER